MGSLSLSAMPRAFNILGMMMERMTIEQAIERTGAKTAKEAKAILNEGRRGRDHLVYNTQSPFSPARSREADRRRKQELRAQMKKLQRAGKASAPAPSASAV